MCAPPLIDGSKEKIQAATARKRHLSCVELRERAAAGKKEIGKIEKEKARTSLTFVGRAPSLVRCSNDMIFMF